MASMLLFSVVPRATPEIAIQIVKSIAAVLIRMVGFRFAVG
jgi:hypothetical protein